MEDPKEYFETNKFHLYSDDEILHMRALLLCIKNDVNGLKYKQKTIDKLLSLGKCFLITK